MQSAVGLVGSTCESAGTERPTDAQATVCRTPGLFAQCIGTRFSGIGFYCPILKGKLLVNMHNRVGAYYRTNFDICLHEIH